LGLSGHVLRLGKARWTQVHVGSADSDTGERATGCHPAPATHLAFSPLRHCCVRQWRRSYGWEVAVTVNASPKSSGRGREWRNPRMLRSVKLEYGRVQVQGVAFGAHRQRFHRLLRKRVEEPVHVAHPEAQEMPPTRRCRPTALTREISCAGPRAGGRIAPRSHAALDCPRSLFPSSCFLRPCPQ